MELAKQRRLAIGDHLNHEAAESPEQVTLRLAGREARERRQGPATRFVPSGPLRRPGTADAASTSV